MYSNLLFGILYRGKVIIIFFEGITVALELSAASLVDLTYVVERVVEAMTTEKACYIVGAVARCIIAGHTT